MNQHFVEGFEKNATTGGTHVQLIRARGLSSGEFDDLKTAIGAAGEKRKTQEGASLDWRNEAVKGFLEKHPHLKGRVTHGSSWNLPTKHGGHVVAAHQFMDGSNHLHAHGQYEGGMPSARFMQHFTGHHEKVAGSMSSGRVDRLLRALKKKPALLKQVHGKVRARGLADQARGVVQHSETSLAKATEHAAETQAKGAFRGTSI